MDGGCQRLRGGNGESVFNGAEVSLLQDGQSSVNGCIMYLLPLSRALEIG